MGHNWHSLKIYQVEDDWKPFIWRSSLIIYNQSNDFDKYNFAPPLSIDHCTNKPFQIGLLDRKWMQIFAASLSKIKKRQTTFRYLGSHWLTPPRHETYLESTVTLSLYYFLGSVKMVQWSVNDWNTVFKKSFNTYRIGANTLE